jgi:hypothetical protein
MPKNIISTTDLVALFDERKVLTLPAIKQTVHTNSTMTIYRKLNTIGYQTSYSHSGKYYTLPHIADYDHNGLWEFNGIFFSKYGKLAPTIEHLVNFAAAGYFAAELNQLLHVFVHNELQKITRLGKLRREQMGQEFLYLSTAIGDVQLKTRTEQIQHAVLTDQSTSSPADELGNKDHWATFLSVLNEKQRRLFLGFESLRLGSGGDKTLSTLTGIDVRTITKGRQELVSHNISVDRIRKPGAGRPAVKKKLKF